MPEIGDRVHLYIPGMREKQAFVLNSIRNTVSGQESVRGNFQTGSSAARGQQEQRKTDKGRTNILSWLSELSEMPLGTLVAVGVGTSETGRKYRDRIQAIRKTVRGICRCGRLFLVMKRSLRLRNSTFRIYMIMRK